MAKATKASPAGNIDIQIQRWPIERLKPYEGNARTHSNAQINQIAASMREFGWMLSVAARHFLTVLCLFCLGAMACALPARAEGNSVEVVATDPASPATLNKFDKLNFRIGYSSNRRVRVRVEPIYNGKRVPATNGGMVTYEAGGGEAYFWISFNGAVKIDRADVMLLDDATDKTIATASAALDIMWSGVATGTIRPDADWAQRLGADRQRRAKDDSARRDAKRRASGGGFLDTACDLALEVAGWMVPGYFILQAVFLFRWKGGWRKAALVPIAPMGLLLGYVFYATVIRGSNIAPVVISFAAPVGFIYLGLLWLLRRA